MSPIRDTFQLGPKGTELLGPLFLRENKSNIQPYSFDHTDIPYFQPSSLVLVARATLKIKVARDLGLAFIQGRHFMLTLVKMLLPQPPISLMHWGETWIEHFRTDIFYLASHSPWSFIPHSAPLTFLRDPLCFFPSWLHLAAFLKSREKLVGFNGWRNNWAGNFSGSELVSLEKASFLLGRWSRHSPQAGWHKDVLIPGFAHLPSQ